MALAFFPCCMSPLQRESSLVLGAEYERWHPPSITVT